MHKSQTSWIAAALLIGCAHRVPVCASAGSCGPGQLCSAGRCTRPGLDPIPSDSDRIVVAASEMAVVAATDRHRALPDEIALGGRSALVVLLRFPAPWGNRARIAAAFLTFDVQESAVTWAERWTVSVARVLEPWSDLSVTYARLPKMSAPLVRAEVLPLPERPLRIDVTPIVQAWARGERDENGMAVWASSAANGAPTYASGTMGGEGPRLDVYVR
jgi:hypothetical protein